MTINIDALPREIRDSTRAVLWAYENRNGDKPTKTPRRIDRPTAYATVNDPDTWGSFTDGVAIHEQGHGDGVGIMLGDGLVGIDLDACRDPESGAIESWAQKIVDTLDSYTEVSPSGTGVHVYAKGSLAGERRRRGAFECYGSGRYFTVSGVHLDGAPTTVEERTAELAAVYHTIFGEADHADGADHRVDHQHHHVDLEDVDLLERARNGKNGERFGALYDDGNWQAHYESQSEADLSLCNTLAFYTGCDADRMGRLFHQSALVRAKTDSRRRDGTYLTDTIQKAITDCLETFNGVTMPHVYISQEPEADPSPDPVREAYSFTPPVPDDHFLARWIRYGDGRTDACHEYHEAVGLNLLAGATPTVRAQLSPYPNGLGTNLYELIVGDSTTMRKSTSKDLGQDVQGQAIPDSLSSDHFSPEGFIEQLSTRPYDTTTLFVDEFGELMDKLHHAKHMAGLRGLLMTVYSGNDYVYRRRTKRKTGGEMVKDEDRIESPHLNILGVTTPAVFNILKETDIISGLLPRFAIIMPTAKPDRRPFHAAGDVIESDRQALIDWLARLHAWSAEVDRRVVFCDGVLDRLDTFAAQVETTAAAQSDVGKAMLQRLTPTAVKVAMLIAAGHPTTPDRHVLDIGLEDADAAIQIATRWQADALAFAGRIGESEFERKVDRCLRLVQRRRKVRRITVARNVKVDRRTLDSIRDTLADRGQIVARIVKADAGPNTEWWDAPTGKKGKGRR